jgi:hypothetical protein
LQKNCGSGLETETVRPQRGLFKVKMRISSHAKVVVEVKKEAPATTFISLMKQGLRQEV